MSDITITIHGGNNQILPNATEAIQNFYVGEYCGETSLEEGDGRSGLMPETIRFRAYINKEEDLERYLAQIVECRTVGPSHSGHARERAENNPRGDGQRALHPPLSTHHPTNHEG